MPKKYTQPQIDLQRRFQTERLASRLSEAVVRSELSDGDSAFIASRDMFFLATVDAGGQPSCSYKGGDPGFVRVESPTSLSFPLYNGNGMYLSAGNVAETAKVGLLFIDFETPHRLRIEGTARLLAHSESPSSWPGAELVTQVSISSVFVNCPRYVHRYSRESASKYIPRAGATAPLPAWKRIDIFQDALPPSDAPRVAENGGPISLDQYRTKLRRGDA